MKRKMKIIFTPRLFMCSIWKRIGFFFTDAFYLRVLYLLQTGQYLNLKQPRTYNEKLQWLKLNDKHVEYTDMVDKYAVKNYVSSLIGKEYIIPNLGVWNNFAEINFDSLPNQFVLKTTHDSGGVVIVKDKQMMDLVSIERTLTKSLCHNFYRQNREYPYKRVKPRIIAEQYMVDESGIELKDYKFFCFNGIPKAVQIDYDRFNGHKRNIYDTNWNRLPFTLEFPTDWNRDFPRPLNFQKMLDIASRLSKGIPHVRVDLYNVNGRIYFGELTFFHGAGFEHFEPEEWNRIFGDWLNLNTK